MKKYLLYVVFALAALPVCAQFNAEKDPVLSRSLASENVKNVVCETSGGSIAVTGVSASEARIEVYAMPNNYRNNRLSEEEIKAKMEKEYDLTVNVSNNTLTAIAKPKDRKMNWKHALSFSFRIFVPQNVSTRLSTSGGSISLKNLSGDHDFATSGGSLSVEKLEGKIKGRTSGGSISIKDTKDDVDLATSGGSINARNCEGKLRLSTSGGSLHLEQLGGDIKATTSGGSINGSAIKGELVAFTSGGSIRLRDLSCSIETATSGGSIDVSISELGQYVKISNSGGNIDVQMPGNKGIDLNLYAHKVNTKSLANFSGKIEDDEIEGKLNGGGIPVTIKAGSGRIHLDLK